MQDLAEIWQAGYGIFAKAALSGLPKASKAKVGLGDENEQYSSFPVCFLTHGHHINTASSEYLFAFPHTLRNLFYNRAIGIKLSPAFRLPWLKPD